MNIIVDSKFNPFSYTDLTAPMRDYREEYGKAEEAYSDLVSQTEAWADIANREKSPEAYEMYRRYSTRLQNIANDFARGMTPGNRAALLGLKRDYAKEITPIAKASEAMQAANNLRDLAGPDAIFEVGRYDSIDLFLHGLTANNKFESRKDIVARTAAMSLAVAQSILEDPIIKNSMSPQFLEIIQKRGLGSMDELAAAIAGNPAASNRFALIRNQMIQQVGGLDRFDAAGRTAIEGAINEGLYAGLNNYQTSLQANGEYMTKAQRDASAQNWAQINETKRTHNYLIAKDLRTQGQAEGKIPIAVRPDGTKVFRNSLGESWTQSPVKVKVTAKNRDAIAKSRGVSPEDITIGKKYYQYKDSEGNTYYGSTPYGYNTGRGNATLQYNKASAVTPPAPKTPAKLGNILGVTNLKLSTSGAAIFDKGTDNKVYDKDALQGATLVPASGTTRAEDVYISAFLRDHPGVKKENLAFYRQWVDEDGDVTSPNTEGAKQVLLITDK